MATTGGKCALRGWAVRLIFMSPYIRTVRTDSGATAVQVVYSQKRGAKTMKHLGSAHTDEDLALLKAQAQRLLDGDQMSLDLGVDTTPAGRDAAVGGYS